MESLNLTNLASSLPPSGLAAAEKELANEFKAAALSLTTFYRASRRTSSRAYNAGYAAACADILAMVQQGVSDGAGEPAIGRIMDYVEARLEAVRSREEEEEEEDERERKPAKAPAKPSIVVPLTPHTPSTSTSYRGQQAPAPSSPSPPSPPLPSTRPSISSKSKLLPPPPPKETFRNSPPPAFSFSTPPYDAPIAVVPAAPVPMPDAVGMKRRHAVMLETGMPTAEGATPAVGTSRRRTRSARGGSLGLGAVYTLHDQNRNLVSAAAPQSDAMDVEEDGRERKRVARR